MPQLIINADDFGLTPGVNRAIEELYRAGVLTSATLMASGAAFDDAVQIAHRNPDLAVGCHIVLTDGAPVSPPSEIPSLIEPSSGSVETSSFRSSLSSFYLAILRKQISHDQIEAEATAQIKKLLTAGIHVSHIDTHKHTHLLPPVARAVIRAAVQCGVHAIRNPFEQSWSSQLTHGAFTRRAEVMLLRTLQPRFLAIPEIKSGQIITCNGSIGVSATGNLDSPTLARLLAAVPEGTWELVCHPGYNDTALNAVRTRLRATREIEMQAISQQIPLALNHGLTLTHYGKLAATYHTESTQ